MRAECGFKSQQAELLPQMFAEILVPASSLG